MTRLSIPARSFGTVNPSVDAGSILETTYEQPEDFEEDDDDMALLFEKKKDRGGKRPRDSDLLKYKPDM